MLADSGIRRMRMLSLSLLATGLLSAGVAFAEPCASLRTLLPSMSLG